MKEENGSTCETVEEHLTSSNKEVLGKQLKTVGGFYDQHWTPQCTCSTAPFLKRGY